MEKSAVATQPFESEKRVSLEGVHAVEELVSGQPGTFEAFNSAIGQFELFHPLDFTDQNPSKHGILSKARLPSFATRMLGIVRLALESDIDSTVMQEPASRLAISGIGYDVPVTVAIDVEFNILNPVMPVAFLNPEPFHQGFGQLTAFICIKNVSVDKL